MYNQRNASNHSLADGRWLPLMEYAIEKGVSLSTLRRHIKANKVAYRIENGRYLIHDAALPQTSDPEALQDSVIELNAALRQAHEEIAELKMLIALYEERMPHARLDV